MKFISYFVLIFSTVGINDATDDSFQLFSQCDRTVGTGVATCMQYFSPLKFVTDFLGGNKDSLCCTHFRHTACIRGVRDAVQVAKAANLCPDSVTDDLISTITDSTVDGYIRKSCKSFNAGKCVMNSVGDVVNTIQGFFVPQQQKPVIPQLINRVPQIFNTRGGNRYNTNDYNNNNDNNNNDNYNPNPNHNYNYDTDRNVAQNSYQYNPFREIINRRIVTSTQSPLINKSIRDLFNGQYIPEASDVKPTKEELPANEETEEKDPLSSLFTGLFNSKEESDDRSDNPSIIDSIGSIGSIFNSDNNNNNKKNNKNGQNLNTFLSDIFNTNTNGTDSRTIVKDITDSIN